MSVTYVPDTSNCSEWDGLTAEQQQTATALAWRSLRLLTGGLLGNPPVLVRPCRSTCAGLDVTHPYVVDGEWYNATCQHGDDCGCLYVPSIRLPGRAAEIVSVVEGGATLNAVSYRLVNGRDLWRLDGNWPLCQDLAQPADGPDALAITYIPGVKPETDGLYVAGVLACEFGKAVSGTRCRLPSSVTSVVRQGVSMEFTSGMFAGGVTGIREVDAYVKALNPNVLSQPSRVWTPDTRKGTFHS